jgi:hypothetical protein
MLEEDWYVGSEKQALTPPPLAPYWSFQTTSLLQVLDEVNVSEVPPTPRTLGSEAG